MVKAKEDPCKLAKNFFDAQYQDLQYLFTKVKIITELDKKIKPYLSKTLKAHCQVANFSKGQLTILSTQASAAMELRFMVPELLAKFQQDPDLNKIKEIHCKISPSLRHTMSQEESSTHAMSPLSQETAKVVREGAESIEDPTLKAIMLKIANRSD